MRILLLTILIILPFYYFKHSDNEKSPKIDAIKLKSSAPDRAERILTVEPTKPSNLTSNNGSEDENIDNSIEDEQIEESHRESSFEEVEEVDEVEEVEEVQTSEVEENWNNELKDILNRLDPIEGDEIHSAYLQEQEAYKAMMESLVSEKEQKTSEEALSEIDNLISQLEEKYQEKIRTILGPHFEAVNELHAEYLQSLPAEE